MEDKGEDARHEPFLIIGLGNPGDRYAETRHNAGFWFLDRLVKQCQAEMKLQRNLHAQVGRAVLGGRECMLARPTTFMNDSGRAVRAVTTYYRIPAETMLIAYDELDLAPGTARLKVGGGHGGHNGLRNVVQCLGHGDFCRLRIGIGHPGHKEAVTPWVLSRAGAEQSALIRAAIERAIDVLPDVLEGRLERAMTRLHTEVESGAAPEA